MKIAKYPGVEGLPEYRRTPWWVDWMIWGVIQRIPNRTLTSTFGWEIVSPSWRPSIIWQQKKIFLFYKGSWERGWDRRGWVTRYIQKSHKYSVNRSCTRPCGATRNAVVLSVGCATLHMSRDEVFAHARRGVNEGDMGQSGLASHTCDMPSAHSPLSPLCALQ